MLGLLTACLEPAHRARPFVVDPAGAGRTSWTEPDPKTCDLVAFLHVYLLSEARLQVGAASAWCKTHGKALWLLEKDRATIEMAGVFIEHDATEVKYAGVDDAASSCWLTLIRNGRGRAVSLPSAITAMADTLGPVCGARYRADLKRALDDL